MFRVNDVPWKLQCIIQNDKSSQATQRLDMNNENNIFVLSLSDRERTMFYMWVNKLGAGAKKDERVRQIQDSLMRLIGIYFALPIQQRNVNSILLPTCDFYRDNLLIEERLNGPDILNLPVFRAIDDCY